MADSYDKLERLCLKYMNEDDFSKVEQAYCFAAEKHCNQKRRSGEKMCIRDRSYNLFFYHLGGRTIAKALPRWVVSPYFVGYRLAQVNACLLYTSRCV